MVRGFHTASHKRGRSQLRYAGHYFYLQEEQAMCGTPDSDNFSSRRFPVLLGDQQSIWLGVPDSIPWATISPHEHQARANHGQSLEILAQRGGLSPYELLAVLLDQPFWRCSLPEPATVIKKLKESMPGFES
jgi:hypothetical protein